MNRLFKGAIAGAAGVALLLGGAGTFALWNDGVDAGTPVVIDAGHLRFGTVPEGTWYVNGVQTTPAGIEAHRVVPGDVLEYRLEEVPIVAHGTALAAQLGIDWAGVTAVDNDGDMLTDVDASQTLLSHLAIDYMVDGQPGDTVEIAGSDTMAPQPIDIAVKITFKPTTPETEGMGGRVDLSGFRLTLTQVPTAGQAS